MSMTAERQEKLIEMVKGFSDEYLDDEYKDLNIRLALKLFESDASVQRGRLENWACAIILTVGQLNFLFDHQTTPYVTQDFLCSYFGSKRQTITIKARDIRRSLNLKLGDEEFSTDFVLMMNIPESDVDLKRIRQLDEVKFLVSQKPPSDVWDVENTQLTDLIHDNQINDKFYSLLRSAYFICFYSGHLMLLVNEDDGKFKIPLFTSMDECNIIMGAFKDVEPKTWPLVNVLTYLGNDRFNGVILNPDVDDFIVTDEMIDRVYANHENIDYWQIFYAR